QAVSMASCVDAVIALGGGSTLDAAKVLAALLGTGRPCADFRLGIRAIPERQVPLIAIPTTAGTGSEATSISILSDDNGVKYWYWAEGLKPDHIVIDPELMTGLPAVLTAQTGVDALVHAIEASTNRNATDLNNFYAHEAIRLCLKSLPRAVTTPDCLTARGDMALAACYAGIAIDNAGTAVAHAIGHALASLVPMHHGLSVAIGKAAALPAQVKSNERFDALAQIFGVSSRLDLPDAFMAFLADVRLELRVDLEDLRTETLSAQMMKPENEAMLQSTDLVLTPGLISSIAERSIEVARGRAT
ncbi:MAG: iron-containing alcohol dehydrogenase, partial [Pseudomonadota bacterium]